MMRYRRLLNATLAFIMSVLGTSAWGQSVGPGGTDKPPGPKVLTLTARGEPDPALKYRFIDAPVMRVPGESTTHLLRAFAMLYERQRDIPSPEMIERVSTWYNLPIDELPKKEVAEYLAGYEGPFINELRQAAMADRNEYVLRLHDLRGIEMYSIVLPEFQSSRELARILNLRARLAIAEGREADALESLRYGYRLGELISEMGDSFLIAKLVSIAIINMMDNTVEDWMQRPDAPNFYWALATLPDSMGSLRESLAGEAFAIERVLRTGSPTQDENLSDEGWREQLVGVVGDFLRLSNTRLQDSEPDFGIRMFAGLAMVAYSDAARVRLAAHPDTAAEAATMSPSEALLRGTRLHVTQVRDEYFKYSLLPAELQGKWHKSADDVLTRSSVANDPATIIAGLLFPALNQASRAGTRTLVVRNRLITIEALRAHAAAHNNEFPATLDELDPLPAWRNPETSEAFDYQRISPTEAMIRTGELYPSDPNAELKLILRQPTK